jgi:hypothetical protein
LTATPCATSPRLNDMQFNDTTNKSGLIQQCERWTNLGDAGISGDSFLLARFTADINAAFDEILPLIFASDAKWQWDDSNHTKYPVATTDLVSGQADYTFIADEQGNSVLEIAKVYVMDTLGIYQELKAVDAETDVGAASILAEASTNVGMPNRYDKLGPSIFLDPIPNYTAANGVRAVFSRAPSYFVSSDTTKTPGIPAPFHQLLALVPSRDYVAIHKPDNTALLTIINNKITEQKTMLKDFLSKRSKDERVVLRPRVESSR